MKYNKNIKNIDKFITNTEIKFTKKVKIYAEVLEQEALEQFIEAMSQDFVVKGALMADAHSGYTLPIGGVIATKNIIVPAYVGYDIGCGMCAAKLDLTLDNIDLKLLFERIKAVVPVGRNQFHEKQIVPDPVSELIKDGLNKKGYYQLGTLGGGNHFLEVGIGTDNKIWIIVHSGSRNLGHYVASHYMKLAKNLSLDLSEFADEFAKENINFAKHNPKGYEEALEKYLIKVTEKHTKIIEGHYGLDVSSNEGKAYIRDMKYCLEYALMNRKKMIDAVVKELGFPNILEFINRNHNHVELKEDLWIHRKGATHAEVGMKGVIPGNMRDGSFIVEGLGNEDAICSSSHGAGRILSRKKANEVLSLNDFISTMSDAGIIGNIDKERLDESPDAYKNIHEVIAIQEREGLITVLDWIRPLINIKG